MNSTPLAPTFLSGPRRLAWSLGLCATLAPATLHALPSFARQMNMQCTACHTDYPILNQFGREFKLNGYTQSAEQSDLPPIAVMLQPSFTHTEKGQDGGAAPGFGNNNNYATTQISLFYAGRLFGPYAKSVFGDEVGSVLNKIGVFSQTTYDGVAKTWSWDNTEIRFTNAAAIGDKDVTYGIYLNNNPTMQDPWNSTPAWGFPFVGSSLTPTPAAGTFIDGAFAAQVVGLGGYIWFNNSLYADFGLYRTLDFHTQRTFGVTPDGQAQISSPAPYWRLAYQKMIGDGHLELGTFGMSAKTYPGRDQSEGTDRFTDVGFDTQYQIVRDKHQFTALASLVLEHQNWAASSVLGNSSNSSDDLHTFKITANDVYDQTYGGSIQYFAINGSQDDTLYSGSANGRPNSDGLIFQVEWMPFNKKGGPAFWPRSNVQFTVQYTMYNKFNGARTNFDGSGGNARDNNTWYLTAWIVF